MVLAALVPLGDTTHAASSTTSVAIYPAGPNGSMAELPIAAFIQSSESRMGWKIVWTQYDQWVM